METEQKELKAISSILRFGRYEVDLERRELRRSGLLIRLQSQPFTLLVLLLERPNQVVTRMEMREALWGENITVDFEQSLSSAIKKLREALEDAASNPLFIETVARRGYRFIAPVTTFHVEQQATEEQAQTKLPEGVAENRGTRAPESPSSTVSALAAVASTGEGTQTTIRERLSPLTLLMVCALVLIAAVTLWGVRSTAVTPTYRISQITTTNHVFTGTKHGDGDIVPGIITDGPKIYFPMFEGGKSLLSSALVGDGEISVLHLPPEINMPIPTDISPDLTRLLVIDRIGLTSEHPLWIVPVNGGGAERVANTLAHDAVWTKDGTHILFARENKLYQARADGYEVTPLASLPSRASWMRWSPDGKRLRFTMSNLLDGKRSLWQIDSNGSNLRPVLPHWKPEVDICCGSWTEDGKHFFFSVTEDSYSDLWQQDEKLFGLLPWASAPYHLTNGPLDFLAPLASKRNSSVFAIGLQQSSRQFRFNPMTRQVLPDLPLPSEVKRTEFSADGLWMAWIDSRTGSLWRSRSDGTLRLQLTTPPNEVWMMKWSPDAKQIAYISRTPGEPWKIHVTSSVGGQSWVPLPQDRGQTDVEWSPDGRYLLFGRVPDSVKVDSEPKYLSLYDLTTHKVSTVPGSLGMTSPRYSPDGKHIAALKNDGHQLVLFDTESHQWRMLEDMPISDPVWAHDGRSLFFLAFQAEGRTVFRFSLSDGHLEHVIGIEDMRLNDVGVFWFHSLAPGDTPLIRLNTSNANLYSIRPNQ